jgi:hypothetical protein
VFQGALDGWKYSIEILGMIKDRVRDEEKARSFRNFAQNVLEIDKPDIDPEVKEAWKMQFRPVDEVVRDIYIYEAKQEGRQEGRQEGMFEAAQNFLKMGFPVKQIAEGTGLTIEELGALRQQAELKSARADSSLDDAGTDSRSSDSA